ncbi:hypothetical protein [Clavibacter sp. CT19]|uniref:hypothetical protein n=1 Tax=unclassified Clavibacter TaxID=2626594 RepID=UPI0022EB86AC|nr:hypothetical protein [Clavibacter sp. CT19]MDA3803791.1 hypothetical protein [Clavibacter sp. CT19]
MPHATPHDDEPRTLLHVLPWTTAVGGAVAVLLIPGSLVALSSITSRAGSDDGRFLPVVLQAMLFAAVMAFVVGLAAGALAGLPDHLARHRPELRRRTSALAVVILTAVISLAWLAVLAEWQPLPLAPTLGTTGVVAAITAGATAIVVARHARRRRRKESRPSVTDA